MKVALRANEYVRDTTDFHPLVFVIPNFLFIIGVALLLLVFNRPDIFERVSFFKYFRMFDLPLVTTCAGVLLIIPVLIRHLDNHMKTYMVTNQRVCFRRGIIAVTERNVPLTKINDVQLEQSFIQRIFNSGDIVIQTGNDEHVAIKDITHPVEFRNQILFAIRQDVSMVDHKSLM